MLEAQGRNTFRILISLLIEVCCYENSAFILCCWLPRHCLNNDDMKTPSILLLFSSSGGEKDVVDTWRGGSKANKFSLSLLGVHDMLMLLCFMLTFIS